MRHSIVCAVVLGGISAASCSTSTSLNPNHCSNNEGNDWCLSKYDDGSRPFCARIPKESDCGVEEPGDGCLPEKPKDECYAPCGCGDNNDGDAQCDGFVQGNTECLDDIADSSTSDTTADGTDSTGSGDDTDSGEDTTTGVPSCTDHPDCTDSASPLCDPSSQTCVPCEELGGDADSACAAKNDAAPVCASAGCVACTDDNIGACSGTSPICDGLTNSCGPCTAHAQCETSGACHIAEGSCFPETVVHVGPGEMYATIGEALDDVQDEAFVIILHENSGGNPYLGTVAIDDGRIIAIFAADGDEPVLQGTSGAALTVANASTLYLRGVTITDSSAQGLVGSGQSVVYLEDTTVDGNDGVGLQATNATLVVDRSRITGNQQGGISIANNSNLSLVNSFVGGDINDIAAIDSSNSEFSILYTTIVAGFGDATALSCDAGSDSSLRNSIAIARTDSNSVACSSLNATTNAFEESIPGNTMIDPMQTSWFSSFATGNFALSPQGATIFENVARWRTGDPPTDIDGTERPTEDDTPDYAGAYVPPS